MFKSQHRQTRSLLVAGGRLILSEIRKVRCEMSTLSDAVAKLAADDAALSLEVDAAIAVIVALPETVAAAVSQALADAGVDNETAAAAIAAVDSAVVAQSAKLTDALKPAAPAPVEPPAADTKPAETA